MKRYSAQRELIKKTLMSVKSHPTAAWIHDRVRETMPDISLGTVYRNLRDMVQQGEIMSFTPGDGKERFDGHSSEHAHLFCDCCGSVSDVELSYDPEFDLKASSISGADIRLHRLVFYGRCQKCLNKNS